jgi:hypothetical protein
VGKHQFVLFLAVSFTFFSGCKNSSEEEPTGTQESLSTPAPEDNQGTTTAQDGAPDKNQKNNKTVSAPGAIEFETEMRAIASDVTEALASCRKNGLVLLAGDTNKVETATKITEGCADLLAQRSKHAEALWGRSYTVDGLLASLARFEDELRIFQVTLASKAATEVISNMSEHVMEAAKSVAISANTVTASRMKEEATRYTENDSNDIGKLLERFDLYAHQQGANADLVRGASLEHYGVSNQRRLAHRKKWFELTTTTPPNASDQVKALSFAYIEVTKAFLTGYLTSVKAFRSGAITDQAGADANRAELVTLYEAWLGAQTKLLGDLEAL